MGTVTNLSLGATGINLNGGRADPGVLTDFSLAGLTLWTTGVGRLSRGALFRGETDSTCRLDGPGGLAGWCSVGVVLRAGAGRMERGASLGMLAGLAGLVGRGGLG